MNQPARSTTAESPNVGLRLSATAELVPDQLAIAMPTGVESHGALKYESSTFRELDDDSSHIAAALLEMGIPAGSRIVLMVPPSADFFALTFALFKAGMVVVLIDPGMGREHLLDCLADVNPDGFIGIGKAMLARWLFRKRFPNSKFHIAVGRWWLGGMTLTKLRRRQLRQPFQPPLTKPADQAAIIFTTGSTGPPKGVLYRHGNFSNQVDQIRERYHIQPGEIDLPGFPLFALFNCAMGVTTIVPRMDPTRPAHVDPPTIINQIRQWNVTQAFGSPAMWNRVSGYAVEHEERLPTLRRVLSAGAPVPIHVLENMLATIADDGNIFTPYGATEALPVASTSGRDVLEETAELSKQGKGTCVGRRFSGIEWKVIEIDDGPIESIADANELPLGQIGEIIVRGPVVTTEYVTRTEANPLHKIRDEDGFWHRMGDVGYLDEQDRFWFCGRKAHRVITDRGAMFTIPCEAIYCQHESIYRAALVGAELSEGKITPVLIAEPWPENWPAGGEQKKLIDELLELGKSHELTQSIEHVLLHESLPVDIRHNAKIFREKLKPWAEGVLLR